MAEDLELELLDAEARELVLELDSSLAQRPLSGAGSYVVLKSLSFLLGSRMGALLEAGCPSDKLNDQVDEWIATAIDVAFEIAAARREEEE